MPTLYLSANALLKNYALLKGKTAGCVIPVLKADAYGHGALFALSHLLDAGASFFAVACAYEATELLRFLEKSKHSFTNTRVLVMGAVEDDALPALLSPFTVLSVHSPAYAKHLSSLIAHYKAHFLLPDRFALSVHLKLETGMHRLGLRSKEVLGEILSLPHLSVTGAYSHLACPKDTAYTQAQRARFAALKSALPEGLFTHLSASEGLLRHGDLSCDAVRVGLALYGVAPRELALPLTPVMRLTARVLSVFRAPRGTRIGYGNTKTDSARRLAVLDIGYADGIPPRAGEGGSLWIKGRVCPLCGAVCMDRLTVDIGDLPLCEGEEIPLFGNGAGDTLNAAESLGVSAYALLSVRSARTRRIYQ